MAVTARTWTAAARRALTRAERAEAAGDLAEAARQLDIANAFFTNAQRAPGSIFTEPKEVTA